jgi:hypothetical protein
VLQGQRRERSGDPDHRRSRGAGWAAAPTRPGTVDPPDRAGGLASRRPAPRRSPRAAPRPGGRRGRNGIGRACQRKREAPGGGAEVYAVAPAGCQLSSIVGLGGGRGDRGGKPGGGSDGRHPEMRQPTELPEGNSAGRPACRLPGVHGLLRRSPLRDHRRLRPDRAGLGGPGFHPSGGWLLLPSSPTPALHVRRLAERLRALHTGALTQCGGAREWPRLPSELIVQSV